jgi:hypothetical protein
MATASRISHDLDHLAWLWKQLGKRVNSESPHAGALLTYNAAAALQFHFVLPYSTLDEIADAANRGKAAKIIDDFVWRTRGLLDKAKLKTKKGIGGETGKTLVSRLRSAISTVLRGLPRLLGLPKPTPARADDLLTTFDVESAFSDWLGSRDSATKAKVEAVSKTVESGPRAGLRAVLAGASVVSDESVYGKKGKEYRKGSSQMLAALLSQALGDYTATLSKKSARRMTAFVGNIIGGLEQVSKR